MPAGLLYERDFISPDEERALLSELARLPFAPAAYKSFTARRRVMIYGSAYDFAANRLTPAPDFPEFLLALRRKAAALIQVGEAAFGHALINEYRPGTPLGWHRDVGEFDSVVGVSLAGRCRMRFRRYPAEKRAQALVLEVEPRSVYVLRDEIRWRWQHSVAPTKELRYSITFRTRR
ncbi:MAG: alpha-ketoglutarate-dependent dioxygenase AlkB [Burkholderiales bacterium]